MEPLIAIVDDDKSVCDALRRLLEAHGFAASAFGSAEEFLRLDGHRRLACLILDMRMPGMNGPTLHEHLIASGCHVPTIMITACPTADERRRAIAAGVISYLAKPLSEDVLLDSIHEALKDCQQADGD